MEMIKKEMVGEEGWILAGDHKSLVGWNVWLGSRVGYVSGSPGKVEVSAQLALDLEETHGGVIGFYHTHPEGVPVPSDKDLRTMRDWVDCFGKELLCVIEGKDSVAAWVFYPEDSYFYVKDKWPRRTNRVTFFDKGGDAELLVVAQFT